LPKPVIDVWGFLMGLGAVVPWVANISTYLTRHVWVHGLDGACSSLFFNGTIV
jgi:hypothetical protein